MTNDIAKPQAAYADNAWYGPVTVEENVPLARDTYRIRFACPEIARRIVPGQFLMLRLADCNDPLLGRPLALYDVVPDAAGRPHFDRRRLSCGRQDDPAAGRVSAGLRSSKCGARWATAFRRRPPNTW